MAATSEIFSLDVDLPATKVPAVSSRLGLKAGLQEMKLAPVKDHVMVCTTVERVDNVANSVSLQVIDGGTKPLLILEARKVYKSAPAGHVIAVRKDFTSFSWEPNINYSPWQKSSTLQARWFKEWKGNLK